MTQKLAGWLTTQAKPVTIAPVLRSNDPQHVWKTGFILERRDVSRSRLTTRPRTESRHKVELSDWALLFAFELTREENRSRSCNLRRFVCCLMRRLRQWLHEGRRVTVTNVNAHGEMKWRNPIQWYIFWAKPRHDAAHEVYHRESDRLNSLDAR